MFLQYMFSDEGLRIFMDSTHMPAPGKFEDPSKMDTSGFSSFGNALLDRVENSIFITASYNCKFYKGNTFIQEFYKENPQRLFTPVNASEQKTAADIWRMEYSAYKESWADACGMLNIDASATQGTNSVVFYGRANPLDE